MECPSLWRRAVLSVTLGPLDGGAGWRRGVSPVTLYCERVVARLSIAPLTLFYFYYTFFYLLRYNHIIPPSLFLLAIPPLYQCPLISFSWPLFVTFVHSNYICLHTHMSVCAYTQRFQSIKCDLYIHNVRAGSSSLGKTISPALHSLQLSVVLYVGLRLHRLFSIRFGSSIVTVLAQLVFRRP